MERTVTKQVRLTKAEARRLAQVAKSTGKSESEVLRMGIDAGEANEERIKQRRVAFEALARMAEEVPGPTGPPGRHGFR